MSRPLRSTSRRVRYSDPRNRCTARPCRSTFLQLLACSLGRDRCDILPYAPTAPGRSKSTRRSKSTSGAGYTPSPVLVGCCAPANPSGLDDESSPACTVTHDLIGSSISSISACGWRRSATPEPRIVGRCRRCSPITDCAICNTLLNNDRSDRTYPWGARSQRDRNIIVCLLLRRSVRRGELLYLA